MRDTAGPYLVVYLKNSCQINIRLLLTLPSLIYLSWSLSGGREIKSETKKEYIDDFQRACSCQSDRSVDSYSLAGSVHLIKTFLDHLYLRAANSDV